MLEKFENKTVLCLWYPPIPIDNFNALNRLKMDLHEVGMQEKYQNISTNTERKDDILSTYISMDK